MRLTYKIRDNKIQWFCFSVIFFCPVQYHHSFHIFPSSFLFIYHQDITVWFLLCVYLDFKKREKISVMVPNLRTVMSSSVTINTGRKFISVAVSSTQPNTWQSDWRSTLCCIILSLIYFVLRKPKLRYSLGPFTGPQQLVMKYSSKLKSQVM